MSITLGKVRQGGAGHGKARHGMARQGMVLKKNNKKNGEIQMKSKKEIG